MIVFKGCRRVALAFQHFFKFPDGLVEWDVWHYWEEGGMEQPPRKNNSLAA